MGDSLRLRIRAWLDELFQGYEGPQFAVRLWDGWEWACRTDGAPACTMVLADPAALTALLAKPNELTLGDAFISGALEVEGDLFSAFAVAEHLFSRPRRMRRRIAEKAALALFGLGQWMRHGAVNSRRRDRASIAYHYDQPVSFFEPWLGESLVYSCAYFHQAGEPLDQAQRQKLDLVCRKLRLKPGERFLDIGCGWGSLALHAAGCGAQAHGITLSREQAATAQRRIERRRISENCTAELRDYRDLDGDLEPFDKIASVGMFEHVGLKNLPLYFGIAYRLLKPGGLMLNHAIARSQLAPVRADSFIERYVFPDGRLVTLTETLEAAQSQGFEVRDVENLREHYELTLRQWVAGLKAHREELLRQVPEKTYRIWLLYMAGSAAAFRRGNIAVYQTLLSRPDKGKSGLPLTRADLYAAQNAAARGATRPVDHLTAA
ncbi:MAG TPA: cyclopropane-fatty-acyl-phospholipid synthase family protein [Terracidiphilus sp.]|nr:cyclopropane-fatty-acyl-phospholipid synthase family protein [Terracidiphilus sp.]